MTLRAIGSGASTVTDQLVLGNLTISSGTANGVTYLNGSKVLTSGSALTFDGTNLVVGNASANNGRVRYQNSTNDAYGEISTVGGTDFRIESTYGSTAGYKPLTFYTNGSEQMRLTSTGLGIGTSSPSTYSAKLAVVGASYFAGGASSVEQARFGYTDGTSYWGMGRDNVTTGNFIINNAGTTVATFSTSGNVGIGTSSPGYKLHVARTDAAGTYAYMGASSDNGARGLIFSSADNGAFLGAIHKIDASSGSGILTLATAGLERMRIDSSGNLLVGTTSANGLGTTISGATHVHNSSDANDTLVLFRYQGTTVGSISRNTTSTSYNTSSDYRLKENIQPMTGALAKVSQLKPCTYKWKADGSDGQGFIAHELAEVVPQCVTGEKDAVDTEGKPQYQGVDTSFLVATLTAALQELSAKFDAYVTTHP